MQYTRAGNEQGGLGRVSRLAESLEQRRDGLIDSLGSKVALLHSVESLGGSRSDGGVLVDKGGSDRSDDGVLVLLELSRGGTLPENATQKKDDDDFMSQQIKDRQKTRGLQDLAESKATSLSNARVRRGDTGLENRDHLDEDPLSVLAAQLAQGPRSSLKSRAELSI